MGKCSVILFDWVPLPAPGGQRSTTGPIVRKICSDIELAPSRSCTRVTAKPTIRSLLRPVAAAANPSALGSEAIIMPHDELRFDLIDRVHGHSHHNQQRRPTKIKRQPQSVQHPVWKVLKEP